MALAFSMQAEISTTDNNMETLTYGKGTIYNCNDQKGQGTGA